MTSAKQFFADNITRLPAPSSPHVTAAELREYNLNSGLQTLAKQIDQMQSDQARIHQEIQRIEQIVRGLR